MNKIIKAGLIGVTLFGFALTASATGTWTAPTASAPGSNVDAPINVGTASQNKNGTLGVQGFADFGTAVFGTGTPVTGATATIFGATVIDPIAGGSSGSSGGSASYNYEPSPVAMANPTSTLTGFFSKIGSFLASVATPTKAYAFGTGTCPPPAGSGGLCNSTCATTSHTSCISTLVCSSGPTPAAGVDNPGTCVAPAPCTLTLSASPNTSVGTLASSTLHWTSTAGCYNVTVNGSVVDVGDGTTAGSGSVTVGPITNTTSYTATAVNVLGTGASSPAATITISGSTPVFNMTPVTVSPGAYLFTANGSTLINGISTFNNDVGIGTATPGYKLSLIGSTNIGLGDTCTLTTAEMAVGCPAGSYLYQFTSSTNTGKCRSFSPTVTPINHTACYS